MSDDLSHSPRDAWVSLSDHNTLAAPARARELVLAESEEQLVDAIQRAKAKLQPFLVLGEGSNTVFVDDFDGTVILNRIAGIQVINQSSESVLVRVGAGENWHQFVAYAVEQNWYGLENLALIPGLVGAAPIQNIGAYGTEVKSTIAQVDVYDVAHGQHQSLTAQDCEFNYRDSRFKRDWCGNKIITSVTFRLNKNGTINIAYPALAQRVGFGATLKQVFEAVVDIRSEKLPDPAELPNAGSFFKNPIVSADTLARLRTGYPDIVYFAHGDEFKLAAAWLIDKAGWKTKNIDGVSVHQQQALVVVNPHRRSGRAIRQFAQAVQQDIFERYQVRLEIEPRLVG